MIEAKAPEFCAPACMPDGSFEELTLSTYAAGRYAVLFFYPADFTYVCATELPGFSRLVPQLAEREAVLLGISTDTHYTHRAWKFAGPEIGGLSDFSIDYPLVGDHAKDICRAYDVLRPDGLATRGLFVIDREGVVQYESRNPSALGRDLSVPLKILDALLHLETLRKQGSAEPIAPADWVVGRPGLEASTEGVAQYLRKMRRQPSLFPPSSGGCDSEFP
jgi:peroxiredoxin (alkyl hydroperoxide reductase subunit C)